MKTAKLYQRKYGFFAVYFNTAKQMASRDVIREFADRFGLSLDHATLSRMTTKTMQALQADAALRNKYGLFVAKQEKVHDILFQKGVVGGKEIWFSNYDIGRRFLLENKQRKSLDKSCATLNRIHLDLGNLHPDNWTYKVLRPYIDDLRMQKGQSAAYKLCIFIRNFLPQEMFMASRYTPVRKKMIEKAAGKRFSDSRQIR